jgi:ribokinase
VAGSTGGDGERAGPGASGVRPTPPTDATAGRVVVVGSLNLDHTVRVARLPEAGATVSGHEYATAAGGKGLNQAVAAARQGAAVVMIGAVGDDAAGGLLAGVLADERIGTGGLRRVPGPSGTALITVSEDGDNTIVVAPGANGALTPGDVTAASMAGAAVVLCQLEVPMEVVLAALHAGRAAGALTVLNPAPATGPLDPALLALVDLIVPNETEAAMLSGGRGDALSAARALTSGGAGTAVVTLGADGALLLRDGMPMHVPALPVDTVDPTAAGDAFLGAMVAALAEGETVHWAARRGAVAGALAATRAGAVPSLPHRVDVDRIVARADPEAAGPVSPAGSRPRSRSVGGQPGGPRRPQRRGGPGSGRGGPPRPEE